MPSAGLPTSAKGWLVAVAASLAGLIAGMIVIKVLSARLG